MSEPQDRQPDQVAAPSVSTAPSGGAAPPVAGRWWHWDALPHHLGRARTSTVVLSALFLAIFALYLNVRPEEVATRTTPAGGGSDVEAPADPVVPSTPVSPEPTGEQAPTSSPEGTEPSAERTGTPTTAPTTSPSGPGPTTPGSDTGTPAEPTGTSEPTAGTTTDESTPTTSSAP